MDILLSMVVRVESEKEKIDVPLRCGRCGHEWVYHGASDWYTSCGICKAMVNVRKRKRELGIEVIEVPVRKGGRK